MGTLQLGVRAAPESRIAGHFGVEDLLLGNYSFGIYDIYIYIYVYIYINVYIIGLHINYIECASRVPAALKE